MSQEEKIKDLEQRIAIMDADNSSLCADLAHWKKVAAGQKGRLQQMSADNERLNRVIKEKDMAIQGLESQVRDMSETTKKQSNRIEELKGDVAVAEANLEYFESLPWWKKVLK